MVMLLGARTTRSSGTTQGKRKYLLFNEELVESTMQIYRTSYAFRNRYRANPAQISFG